MKLFYSSLACIGLLVLTMTGCHHTAGACDCHVHHGHHVAGGPGHPMMGIYSSPAPHQHVIGAHPAPVVTTPPAESLKTMPKPEKN